MQFLGVLIQKLEKIILNKKKIVILIPAAGKGTRSKLPFPKTLYKVKKIPILIRIIKKLSKYSDKFTLVINSSYEKQFSSILKKYNFSKVEYLYQNSPKGMGDAVKIFHKSKLFNNISDILLIWSDIPYISRKSIDIMLNKHFKENNFMTILSCYTKHPYTLIIKDKKSNVKKIKETYKNNFKFKYGERDIGVFIFKKELLKFLKKDKISSEEHNFLYVINRLYKEGYKIRSEPVAKLKESISLNYINDLL